MAELFLFSSRRSLPLWRTLLYTAGILAAALWIVRDAVPSQPRFPEDGHAIASLNVAFASATCGRGARISYKYQPGKFLLENQSATVEPLRDVITGLAGSIDEYCASTAPYLNEDNSLSLLETLAIELRPNVSANAIARLLGIARLAIVACVCFALLRLGASVALAAACTVAAVYVLRQLVNEGMAYSIHSFFFVLVLLNATVYWAALRLTAIASRWAVPAAAAAGFVSAFSANMRASYLPIYVSFACACVAAAWLRGARRPAGLALLSVVAGYFLFQYPFIIQRIPDTDYNHSFHSISHPLVLGLALPPNSLAEREGIRWRDEDGIVLARRVDPTAKYLGPGYDEALLTYYWSLWRRSPREMLGIYAEKLAIAGADMIQNRWRFPDAFVRRSLIPVRWLTDGRVLFLFFAVAAAAGFWMYVRYEIEFGFWASLLFAAGVLLYLEAALILPYYYPAYQSALLMVTVFSSFIAVQVVVNIAVSSARVAWAMRPW